MLLQLHEVKESLSKQRPNKLEELAKKIKVQTSTLQKNYEANQKQREQLQEAKANAWDEEELDLKRELVIKRLVVAYKTKKFNEKNKVYTDDNNSFKNIQRILNGDDNMTNRAEPKDYDKKKHEIMGRLTQYQEKNNEMEAKIKKIKSEIKEMEIKMDKAADLTTVAEAQDKATSGADQDEKDNAMTFAYSELKSWVGVALNKLLTCQVRDTVSKDSQNSQSLAENFSMLAKHLDEISTELEKSDDLEKDLEQL